MISAGGRNRIVRFQKNVRKKNAGGEYIDDWEDVIRAMGSIKPSQSQFQSENAVNYQVSTFDIDFVFSHVLARDIDVTHRIIIDDKYYRIESIDDLFSRKKITVTVSLYE